MVFLMLMWIIAFFRESKFNKYYSIALLFYEIRTSITIIYFQSLMYKLWWLRLMLLFEWTVKTQHVQYAIQLLQHHCFNATTHYVSCVWLAFRNATEKAIVRNVKQADCSTISSLREPLDSKWERLRMKDVHYCYFLGTMNTKTFQAFKVSILRWNDIQSLNQTAF